MKLRFSIRDLLWLTALVAIVAGPALVGCPNPFEFGFGSQYEKLDLTYNQFHEFLPNEDIDLQNCRHISIAYASSRDWYDFWLKCEMSKSQYETLVAEQTADAETIRPVFDEGELNSAAPKWWKFHSEKPVQNWFREKNNGSSHHTGLAIFFDEKTGTFRLWKWSRQHQRKPSSFLHQW